MVLFTDWRCRRFGGSADACVRATTNAALANFVNMLVSIVTVVAIVAAQIVELATAVVLC